MSEFDKEAEREKLRERFEQEEADRAAAQQMSDLLLKGATMTNAHCGECGSPIFRQNGQEFCPSCGAQRTAEAAEDTGETPGSDAEASGESGAGADATRVDGDAAADGADAAGVDATDTGADATGGQAAPRTDAASAERAVGEVAPADVSGGPTPSGDAADLDPSADDAVTALQRALLRHARAANTDDPRVAREHLEAAREAAATLSALRK